MNKEIMPGGLKHTANSSVEIDKNVIETQFSDE